MILVGEREQLGASARGGVRANACVRAESPVLVRFCLLADDGSVTNHALCAHACEHALCAHACEHRLCV